METWKDNKVDETYAAINRPIRKVADEGGESLGRRVFARNLGQWLSACFPKSRLPENMRKAQKRRRKLLTGRKSSRKPTSGKANLLTEVIYVKEIRYGNEKDYWIKCRKTMMQP